jgi:hypothetical protein
MPLNTTACETKHYKFAKKWKNDFVVMASKNNSDLHSKFKEYFDRPIKLDRNGYYL